MSQGKSYPKSSGPRETVTKPIERRDVDLSHLSFKTGQIGCLQTLSVIPVVAGDSMEVHMQGVMRLSPLVHYMYLDAVVDLFAFYVPHRHVYSIANGSTAGNEWTDFLKAGTDETTTLGTRTFTGTNRPAVLGVYYTSAPVVPRWANDPYLMIWNNYFADPTVPGDQKAMTYLTSLTYPDPILECGIPCCHLKRSWNTGVPSNLSTADYSLALSGGEVDLYQLGQLQGRLRSEQARDWFAVSRYRDVLNYTWDSQVNIDADQRPELVMRQTHSLSGQEINGTSDNNLGFYIGKSQGIVSLSFPMKFFPEHGSVWIMGLVRIPPVYQQECGYLWLKSEPTYKEIACDPMILKKEPPITLNWNEVSSGGSSVDLGKIPYAQWYREQPNMLSPDYVEVAGHPFIGTAGMTSRASIVYVKPSDYTPMFADVQLRHWSSQAKLSVFCRRFIPNAEESIFAGTGAA